MQKGSLIRSSALRIVKARRFGSTAREKLVPGKRESTGESSSGRSQCFKDEPAALKVITALRKDIDIKDININDRRLRTKPLKTRGTGRALSAEVHFSNLLLAEE